MYGVNVPEGLDRKIKKLEKQVEILMKERKERMDAEKKASTVQISEEVVVEPKATKKKIIKKKEEPVVETPESEESKKPQWGDPTIDME